MASERIFLLFENIFENKIENEIKMISSSVPINSLSTDISKSRCCKDFEYT